MELLNTLAIAQLIAALILPTIGTLGLIREGYLSYVLRRKPRKRRLVLFGVVLAVGLLAMLVPISN
jgi:hypothetical protein